MANFSGMSWDDLLRQAQADYASQQNGGYTPMGWRANPDSTSDRYTSIDGLNANINFANPGDWSTANFILNADPAAPEGYGSRLSRADDGTVNKDFYHLDQNGFGSWAPFLMMAGPLAYAANVAGAAGAAGAASGASGSLGTAASGVGDAIAGGSAAGGYSIPTAAELAAAGYDVGGMGLTGASGIGAAGSVAGAGAGAAGYGAATGGGMLSGLTDFLGTKAGSTIAGGLLSGLSSALGPKSTTATSTTQIDPRMAPYIYGENGLLPRVSAAMGAPQNAGMQTFGTAMDNYLKNWGEDNFAKSQQAAQALQSSNIAAPTASAAQVQAPSQNDLNLSPAYQDMIYGEAGNNPYLTGAIQKGINQSNYAFGNYLTDSTKALQDQLSGIRGGAVLNNSMGSSRQGIAEGRALSDFGQNLTRAATQFGQNNTDAAVSAQAGAYDADRNRSLAAMSGLGAQQYGVASQNASMQQQANLANMQSQLATNNLNSDNQRAGIGLSSGLLGQAAGYGQNQDSYDMSKLSQASGLLAPYTGLGATTSQTQPLYQNTTGNILGGALAGASLWKAFQ